VLPARDVASAARPQFPLRICMLVTYDLASPGGGVKQHAVHLAEALRRGGDDVTIVGPSSKPIDLPGFKTFGGVVNISSNGSDNMLAIFASPRAVAAYLREMDFDIIHVHEPLNPSLAYWAVWATPEVPHIATFHAYAETESRLLRWTRKAAGAAVFSAYDRAIAVSEPAARHAAHAWKRPLTIIPNGVPSNLFTPAEPRMELPVRLLFVGRLGDRRKGVRFLIDAYRGLVARELPVTLDIVGELGGAEPPPELPGLTYHGAVELEELTEIYRRCDVFVAPSTGQESFGIVLLEAMASGKVVVCSDIDGYRQVIAKDGSVVVPPGDAQALELALANVVEQEPAVRARQGEINRRVAESFDWDRITEQVRAEYCETIAQHKARMSGAEPERSSIDPPSAPASPQVSRAALGRRTMGMLLALCVVLRIVSLLRPCLSDDEATYAVVGREMLAGQALYRDIVDHKPPAIYLVNEATQAIAGPVGGMVLLHALLILVVWATGLLLAGLVRRYERSGDNRGPPLVALLWIVFTTTLVDADSLAANCELFMMLPLVASVSVFLAARDRLTHFLAAGALVGVAMLFKYQAGIQLPLLALALLISRRHSLGRAMLGVIALGVGVALPILAASAWLSAHGALADAWFWFRFNFAYIDAGSGDSPLPRMLVRAGFVMLAAAPLYALAIAGVSSRERRASPFRKLAIGWLFVSAAAVMVGGRFFGHYFHQVTAPLAILAAPAALALWTRHRGWFATALAVPATVFFVLGFMHDRMMSAAGEPDPDYASLVTYLDQHSEPSDKLCIWGNSPTLYFAANRPLGCRFVFANYITGLSPATSTQTDPTVDSSANSVPQAWDMLEHDLATRQPTFIIDASPGNVGFYGKYPPAKFPRLARILSCQYEPEALVSGMQIYRRLAVARCAVLTTQL
jgi:phosphatidylinositol alpha-mannosyltransferase